MPVSGKVLRERHWIISGILKWFSHADLKKWLSSKVKNNFLEQEAIKQSHDLTWLGDMA